MSRPTPERTLSQSGTRRRALPRRASNPPEAMPSLARRASVSLASGTPKAQRTSKNSQKLVVLPSAPQTKALAEDDIHGYETDAGPMKEFKSEVERMSKEQRKRAGCLRLTAYCVAEGFKMKLLASFLKREHNVHPRVFDEALYVMYHLPLLPGYTNTNVRSSAPRNGPSAKSFMSKLSEAEENGWAGPYFSAPAARSPTSLREGFVASSSPVQNRRSPPTSDSVPTIGESDAEADIDDEEPRQPPQVEEEVAEVIFFEYGVVVFFGLDEGQEKGILDDIDNAGIMKRKISEDDWEVEECHYAHDRHIAYPRIYNDFFTFKSTSHLLKLSVAHAVAQSTLLAHYETNARRVLSDPRTVAIPKQLAASGALQLKRNEALKLTGRLFRLRRDVNLVSNVLDVPELFWSEASLKGLYDAVREYMEIKGRVTSLNDKLGVASEFLDAIHDHLNNNAMERITLIVIWLIVAAIVVDLGEVAARLVFHAAKEDAFVRMTAVIPRDEALRRLGQMMVGGPGSLSN